MALILLQEREAKPANNFFLSLSYVCQGQGLTRHSASLVRQKEKKKLCILQRLF